MFDLAAVQEHRIWYVPEPCQGGGYVGRLQVCLQRLPGMQQEAVGRLLLPRGQRAVRECRGKHPLSLPSTSAKPCGCSVLVQQIVCIQQSALVKVRGMAQGT